ncbi:MAG TPA: DivIVA domain-containing protein [Rubrobacter sp.]|nr:DivIVA domain-containing protein [Rubrobacter sp.]
MPIRPIDIRRKEFKIGFRGYDPNQVDDFLDAVADEFERNYTENQRMREEVSSLRDRLQQFEDLEGSIQAALVHAEQASNDLRRTATQEAESIKQSAQREADFTIREAQSRSHQMLADSSARIERVQDSYDGLQEAKRSFANEFRHLLKTYTDMMENMEVASAREIEASLRERLDTESIAVVREAAQEEVRSAEEAMVTAGMVPVPPDAQDTLSGLEAVEPAEEDWEIQEIGSTADEQPTAVIRPEGSEPETEDPEVAEPEVVEPSTAQDEMDQTEAVQEPPSTEAASEVEREEPSLAEESSSQHFFDREGEQSDSRIFRASRFLRRRE